MKKQESKVMVDGFDTFMKNRRKQEDWTSDIDESSMLTDDILYIEDLKYGDLF